MNHPQKQFFKGKQVEKSRSAKLEIINFSALNSGDKPDLLKLLQFPVTPQKTVNVIEQISTSYRTLGIILLQDELGQRVEAIALQHSKTVDIMQAIISDWLRGCGLPDTWRSLVDSLKKVRLDTIADDIEKVLFD